MQPVHIYEFSRDQDVPSWLYTVSAPTAPEGFRCIFGTSGGVAVMASGEVVVWPNVERLEEEYIFTFTVGFSGSASAKHPAGNHLLKVIPNHEMAAELLGEDVEAPREALPATDPRS